jgi:hypothetical protein
MERNRSTERDVELDEGVANSREPEVCRTPNTPTSTPARAPHPTKSSSAGSRAKTWDTPARPAPSGELMRPRIKNRTDRLAGRDDNRPDLPAVKRNNQP